MAEKTGSSKETGERILNVPLRREWIRVPKNKRGKRALHALRGFVSKHTKSYNVKISQNVNEKIWIRGIQKPPPDIRVKISRDSEGVVHVMLPEEIAKKPKKEEKRGRLEKVKETLEKEKGLPLGGGKEEILKKGKKKEEMTEEKKEEKPKEEKKTDSKKPKK
ncbi:MAG: 50S ribosomal protein L31e [Candidatus Aenigmarchaeota archaeon]|nr:50S ribosomal protein L31e [Candidatus Aenigmarchaeota archaeon]